LLFCNPNPRLRCFSGSYEHADVYLPASVLVEANITATNRGLGADLADMVAAMKPKVIALDEAMAYLAVDAFRRYGKGRHKANLNFGDCLVYATARQLRLPLLFKGNDFVHTDLASVLRA
jgi:ribonuclease VapC